MFIDFSLEAVPSVQFTNACSDDETADPFERLGDTYGLLLDMKKPCRSC